MPRGGRRHRKTNAEHRRAGTYRRDRHAAGGDVLPAAPAAKVPPPPKRLRGAEREAWLEVARQVEAAGTYTEAHFSAFRLAVKALAAVYAAPSTTKATTLRGLIDTASRLIGRFALDPVSRGQVAPPPAPSSSGPGDRFGSDEEAAVEAFLFSERGSRPTLALVNGGKRDA